MINGVIITPLKIIEVPNGNVLHAMKLTDDGFFGFGEAYLSMVYSWSIKAWKRHHDMTLNIVVPVGKIRFVLFDDTESSKTKFQEVTLSQENYCRLTIPPMIWVGFQGVADDTSVLLNIASIAHDPLESDKKSINEIKYNWC